MLSNFHRFCVFQVEAAFACFLIAVSLLVGSAVLLVYLSTTRNGFLYFREKLKYSTMKISAVILEFNKRGGRGLVTPNLQGYSYIK